MTQTLFDLTYQTAKLLEEVRHGLATGGTTSTLIDTNGLKQVDDYWGGLQGNMGTVWMLYDAGALGAAPQGEFSRVTDFVNSTQAATLSPALTAAPASNDQYGIAGPRYPLYDLIAAVNEAVRLLGNIGFDDATTLDTVANQTEYTLPFVEGELKQVYYQGKTGDSDDFQWLPVPKWEVRYGITGSARTLILPLGFPSGRDIRLVYGGPHPRLNLASDKLSESIPEQLIATRAALILTEGEIKKQAKADPRLTERAAMFRNALGEVQTNFTPDKPRRMPKVFDVPNTSAGIYRDRVSPFPPYDN